MRTLQTPRASALKTTGRTTLTVEMPGATTHEDVARIFSTAQGYSFEKQNEEEKEEDGGTGEGGAERNVKKVQVHYLHAEEARQAYAQLHDTFSIRISPTGEAATENELTALPTENSFGELADMIDNKLSFPDVVLLLSDQRIYAHQAILGRKSGWFAQWFKQLRQTSEKNEDTQQQHCEKKDEDGLPILDLTEKLSPSTNLETFRALLQYCYTNKIERSKVSLDLLLLAREVSFWGLALFCEHSAVLEMELEPALRERGVFPICRLDPSLNIFQLLKIATKHELNGLKNFCMDYLLLHFDTLLPDYEEECANIDDDLLDTILQAGMNHKALHISYIDNIPSSASGQKAVTDQLRDSLTKSSDYQLPTVWFDTDTATNQACLISQPHALPLSVVCENEVRSRQATPLDRLLQLGVAVVRVSNIPPSWSGHYVYKFFSECGLLPYPSLGWQPSDYSPTGQLKVARNPKFPAESLKVALWTLDGMKVEDGYSLQWEPYLEFAFGEHTKEG